MEIVVLTGAGISAESGVATFRDADGLWEGHRPEDVATPEAFVADPGLVQRFYDERRASLSTVEPNAAHRALARLEDAVGHDLLVITQNIDDLHERAGSRHVLHMHGELTSVWCTSCDERHRWTGPLADEPPCPGCGRPELRPDIVWFGEIPYGMGEIEDAMADVRLFCAIGTSGVVYPAAGLSAFATARGARTVELNLAENLGALSFHEHRRGPAAELVPTWVDDVLADRLP